MSTPRVVVLIPAAGSGSRMAGVRVEGLPAAPRNKTLLPLAGEPLLRHTVRAFHQVAGIAQVRVIAQPEDLAELDGIFADRAGWPRLGPWIVGGPERQDSVRLGLAALQAEPDGPPDRVLVHDGARPLCSPGLIRRILDSLESEAAAVPVLPIFDTVRSIAGHGTADYGTAGHGTAGHGRSAGVMDRTGLCLTQTPQGFHWHLLWEAHQKAAAEGAVASDDGQLVERLGRALALVPGERRNLKITLPEDLELAEWVHRHPAWGTEPAAR